MSLLDPMDEYARTMDELLEDDDWDVEGTKCKVCGCDNDHACLTPDGPCYWVESDLCSSCADNQAELEKLKVATSYLRKMAANGK